MFAMFAHDYLAPLWHRACLPVSMPSCFAFRPGIAVVLTLRMRPVMNLLIAALGDDVTAAAWASSRCSLCWRNALTCGVECEEHVHLLMLDADVTSASPFARSVLLFLLLVLFLPLRLLRTAPFELRPVLGGEHHD